MRISITKVAGIRPKVAPHLIAGNEAQIAENCTFRNGHILPWYNYTDEYTLKNTGTIRTLYLYEGLYWFEWEADVDIVSAPVSADTQGKVYYTGDGIPKKTNRTEATTGSSAMPINFYPQAVPTPFPAPTASLGSGGTGDARSINYVWTIVTSWYEEGLPSPASNTVNALQGQTVNLTGMTMVWKAGTQYELGNFVFAVGDEGGTYLYKCVEAGTSGGTEPTWDQTVDADTTDNTVKWRCYENNLLEKRIYRLNTGDNYANYAYVASISISSTSYADSKTDSQLGEELPSEDYDPPVDTLKGLTYMGNGIMAGFSGKDLYFSEPYKPWAYPISYSLTMPDAIVGIASVGDILVVLTEGAPHLVTGIDPSAMTPSPLPQDKPCLSKRSIVTYKTGVLYASADGYEIIDGAKIDSATKNILDEYSWAPYYPDTMHSYIVGDKLFCFYSSGGSNGGVVFNLETWDMSTLDFYCDSAYVEEDTSTLYFQKEVESVNHVYKWEGDETQPYPANFTWRSKIFLLPAKTKFQVARLIFEEGDRAEYQATLDDYQEAIARNNALISAGQIGGSIGEQAVGSDIEVNGDNLESVDAPADYSGDFNMIFRLYADGTKKTEREVYSDRPFRLESGYRGREFFFEVEGNLEVKQIDLANSVEELKQLEQPGG